MFIPLIVSHVTCHDKVRIIPKRGINESLTVRWLNVVISIYAAYVATARMAQRFLDDFRRGMLGPLALELP